MILGILFYLMQAREYLQEGMTYKLGCSFYLAWTGVFFFVMIGRGQGRVGVRGLGMGSRMQMGTGVGQIWDAGELVDKEDWTEEGDGIGDGHRAGCRGRVGVWIWEWVGDRIGVWGQVWV